MTTPVAALVSAEAYALMTDPPGVRTELVRGRVVQLPPAGTEHGHLAFEIGFHLRLFAAQHALGVITGEGGYLVARDPDTVRAPDVGFLTAARAGALDAPGYVDGAPDLAVEVVSPDDRDGDVAAKIADWLAAGALRAWEVRPRTRTVTVHRPGAEPRTLGIEATLTSDDAGFAVEGLALPLSAIFR